MIVTSSLLRDQNMDIMLLHGTYSTNMFFPKNMKDKAERENWSLSLNSATIVSSTFAPAQFLSIYFPENPGSQIGLEEAENVKIFI